MYKTSTIYFLNPCLKLLEKNSNVALFLRVDIYYFVTG